jgi:hypothetical protein
MTLDVYAHVFDEFDISERVSAEDQIAQARRDVSGLCPCGSAGIRSAARQSRDFPHASGEKAAIEPYNPISLPRISFMTSEHGTGGQAGSSKGTDSQQISLFEGEDDDRP